MESAMAEQEKDVKDALEEELKDMSGNETECEADGDAPDSGEQEADSGVPDSGEPETDGGAPENGEPETDSERPEDGEQESDSGAPEAGEGQPAKKIFKKQSKADKKAEGYKEQIAQLEDKVKRQLAEFENFRNRTEKEKQAMFETGAKSVIEKILPVVDNFERGLATVPEDKREDPFVDGMNRIYKQMLAELENIGVKPIETVGLEFDPNLHNAVMQVENEEYESGVIVQELQKGYTYRDSVVRHSMVSVNI